MDKGEEAVRCMFPQASVMDSQSPKLCVKLQWCKKNTETLL